MKRNKYFCEHCKKDLNEKVEKNKGIYHVCRGKCFCDECWEYLLDNERKRKVKIECWRVKCLQKNNRIL